MWHRPPPDRSITTSWRLCAGGLRAATIRASASPYSYPFGDLLLARSEEKILHTHVITCKRGQLRAQIIIRVGKHPFFCFFKQKQNFVLF